MSETAIRTSGWILAGSAFGWDWYVNPDQVVTKRRLLRTPITRVSVLAVPHDLAKEREAIIAGREGASRRRFSNWRGLMLQVDVNCVKGRVLFRAVAYFDRSNRIIEEAQLRPRWVSLDQIRQDSPLPGIVEWGCNGERRYQ